MEATNAELYRLALADAPFVIAAYAVLWAAFAGYVTLVLRRMMKLEREVTILEESVERRASKTSA